MEVKEIDIKIHLKGVLKVLTVLNTIITYQPM